MKVSQWFCNLKDPPVKERYPKCMNVPEKMVRKPDPCIYSQGELAASPEQIKWENVDISIFDVETGAFVRNTHLLQENREYRIDVQVHNCSSDVLAYNTKVELFSVGFGIGEGLAAGLTPIPLPQSFVHLPPGGVLSLSTNWVNPATSTAFMVRLTHPDDDNTSNNEGWHATRIEKRHPGITDSALLALYNPFNQVRFIKVVIFEEGPENWFRSHEHIIGDGSAFLPVGRLGLLSDDPAVVDALGVNMNFDIPNTTPVGTEHISHITAYALPELSGPETLVGGATYIIQII